MADMDEIYRMKEDMDWRPICQECEEPIDEFGYDFGGFWICEDCMQRAGRYID